MRSAPRAPIRWVTVCIAAALLLVAGAVAVTASTPPPRATAAAQADMSISKTASPDPAVLGKRLTYTVKVKNNGPGTATGVIAADQIPLEVAFKSAKASDGSPCKVTSLVQCQIGMMKNGETVTITIVVVVKERPFEGDSITNRCSVFSDDDPNPDNDHCTVNTRVIEKGPCIPEAAFTEIDSMKNFLRETIERVENGELSKKQIKTRTRQLDKTKLAMLRAHFPTVFGVEYVTLFRQLEQFDDKMSFVRFLAVLSGSTNEQLARQLKRAQKKLRDLETVLGEGAGVPEGVFTEIDSMKNFLRQTIERVENGELSKKQIKTRTRQLDRTKLAMLRAHFPTVCGVEYVTLFRQLEAFDAKMSFVRRLAVLSGSTNEQLARQLKRAQKKLRDLVAVLEETQ